MFSNARGCVALQEQEFSTQQADAFCTKLIPFTGVIEVADIGGNFNAMAVCCDGGIARGGEGMIVADVWASAGQPGSRLDVVV